MSKVKRCGGSANCELKEVRYEWPDDSGTLQAFTVLEAIGDCPPAAVDGHQCHCVVIRTTQYQQRPRPDADYEVRQQVEDVIGKGITPEDKLRWESYTDPREGETLSRRRYFITAACVHVTRTVSKTKKAKGVTDGKRKSRKA